RAQRGGADALSDEAGDGRIEQALALVRPPADGSPRRARAPGKPGGCLGFLPGGALARALVRHAPDGFAVHAKYLIDQLIKIKYRLPEAIAGTGVPLWSFPSCAQGRLRPAPPRSPDSGPRSESSSENTHGRNASSMPTLRRRAGGKVASRAAISRYSTARCSSLRRSTATELSPSSRTSITSSASRPAKASRRISPVATCA